MSVLEARAGETEVVQPMIERYAYNADAPFGHARAPDSFLILIVGPLSP